VESPPRHSVEKLLLNESFLNYYFRKNETDVWEWEEFLDDQTDQQPVVAEAVALLDRLSLKWNEAQIRRQFGRLQTELAELNTDVNATDLITPVSTSANVPVIGLGTTRHTIFGWAAASVAALLVLVGSWYYAVVQPSAVSPAYQSLVAGKNLTECVNKGAKPQLVMLPDGSSILLQPGSRLSYPRRFLGQSRAVYLEGEAFFEVQKNSRRPFFVYAGALVARVLGTSFTVDARPGSRALRVVVRTGQVSVYRYDARWQQPASKGLVVTPNQQLSLDRDALGRPPAEFTRSLVAEPQLLRQTNGFRFDYRDTPAATVFAQIEQAYGLTLIYDENQLKNCPVTASLTDEPLYEKLSLVCRAIEARYEIIDGQVVISGGCAE
jgi:transmembrane sensor